MWQQILLRPVGQIRSQIWTANTRLLALVICGSLLAGCGSAPVFESVMTDNTGKNGGSSLRIAIPDSDSGDLLVAVLGVKINPATSGPDGWTAVPGFAGFNGATCNSDGEGIACQLSVFYKISSGRESVAIFSYGGTAQAAGVVLRYSRVDTSYPIGAVAEQSGSSNSPTAPAITTTRDDSRVLRIALTEADDVKGALTESLILGGEPSIARFNIVSFSDFVSDASNGCGPPLSACTFTSEAIGLAASDSRKSTAGISGPVSWSLPGTDQWVAASIEIKSPGSDTPVVALVQNE